MSSENSGREELPGDYWIFEQLGSPVKPQRNQKSTCSATELIRKYENAFRQKLCVYSKNMRNLIITARKEISDLKQENTILKHKLLSSGLIECPACLYRFKPESKHRILPKYVKVFRGRLSLEIEFSSLDEMTEWLTVNQLDVNTDGLPTMVDCGEKKLDLVTTGSSLHQLVKEITEKETKKKRVIISTRPRVSCSGASSGGTLPTHPVSTSVESVAVVEEVSDKKQDDPTEIAGDNDEGEAYREDCLSSSSTRTSSSCRSTKKTVESSGGMETQFYVNDAIVDMPPSTSTHYNGQRQSGRTFEEYRRDAHKKRFSAEGSTRLGTTRSLQPSTQKSEDDNNAVLGKTERRCSSRSRKSSSNDQRSSTLQNSSFEDHNRDDRTEVDDKAKVQMHPNAREHEMTCSSGKENVVDGKEVDSAKGSSDGAPSREKRKRFDQERRDESCRTSSIREARKVTQKVRQSSLTDSRSGTAYSQDVHRRPIEFAGGASSQYVDHDTHKRTTDISDSRTLDTLSITFEDRSNRCRHRMLSEKTLERECKGKTKDSTQKRLREKNTSRRKRKRNHRNRSRGYRGNRHNEAIRESQQCAHTQSPSLKRRRLSITSDEEGELVDSDDELVMIDEEEVEDGEIVE